MASSKEYLDFVLDQLSDLPDVSYRPMMGEYILYYRGCVIGGIYDDRFLVKPTPAARCLMPDAPEALPYDGAKPMLTVTAIDDRDFLARLFDEMFDELPPQKKQK